MHKTDESIEEVPFYFFKVIRHMEQKNRKFWPELNDSKLWLQFQSIEGFKMMHTAWYSMLDMPQNLSTFSKTMGLIFENVFETIDILIYRDIYF